ncbi:uncharacterized protein LY89DRAFT_736926 [Mollisia scopiformis]|uniref:DUF7924 domain-containing protein n=1 Tax=Mollisia scopiformis TaxID=149040 RepID=A0A194X262_MOLSC|nr:uncharacterized protein LY89DRAFT_736926 [Mollisia scopiformis]KUJ13927.1 hypothetical protein LY89DRAFT_736926 [Mollisia scopiformis]
MTLQSSAFPLISKQHSTEVELSGYGMNFNYAWSEVDNDISTGLSDAKPDIIESYRKTDYPWAAIDALSEALAPTSYNIGMPAFAVEAKGSDGSIEVAQVQCAYDGALMANAAMASHLYMGKYDKEFYGQTKAVTVAFSAQNLKIYGHHVLHNESEDRDAEVEFINSNSAAILLASLSKTFSAHTSVQGMHRTSAIGLQLKQKMHCGPL